MTNEEKFSKGIVVYRTEDDVICELWGASTKHADVIYSMNQDIKNNLFTKCQFADGRKKIRKILDNNNCMGYYNYRKRGNEK